LKEKQMATLTKITLPVGIARFPHLNRPDTKFVEAGAYKANVAVSHERAAPVIKRLQEIAKAELGKALPKADNSLWKEETDDNGDPTGMVMFKCSVKNVITKDGNLWDRRPVQYDSNLNKVNENIYGGSELAVACDVWAWEYSGKKGLGLQPTAVQIHKLVEGPEGGGDHGFSKADGGFVSEAGSTFADPGPDTTPSSVEAEAYDF
jgi:hypothetical protein